MAVDYATIVAGRVTAVSNGTLPASDLTTLYFDLTGYATPSVTDYFSEICATFSAAPPVIPDGDLAPPYPPGSTPPVPGSPEYPTGPENPGPTPVPDLRPSLVVFHGDATDPITIASCPAAETEIHARMRTRFVLEDACAVRTQVWVITPVTGAEIITKYSLDGGSTFDYLSPGETGPVVDVATAGDRYGSYVNVATEAQGDVLLSPFIRGGDGLTTFVAGNLALLANIRTDATPCEAIEEPEGCAIPGGVETLDMSTIGLVSDYEDREFTPWGGFGDLFTDIDTWSPEPGNVDIDTAETFNDLPTLRSRWLANGDGGGTTQTIRFASSFAGTPIPEIALYHVFKLEDGIDTPDSTAPDDGFALLVFDTDSQTGTNPGREFYLNLRDGRLAFAAYEFGGGGYVADVDLGALSTWTDRWLQLLCHVKVLDATTARVRIYLNDACDATPTMVAEFEYTYSGSDHGVYFFNLMNPLSFPTMASAKYVWQAQWAYDTDPTTYGIVP